MRHLTWHKSSYSSDQGGNCVEVANHEKHHAIRDSKKPAGPILAITTAQWSAFTTAVQANQFD